MLIFTCSRISGAQLAGDALHHRVPAANLRRARHQRADDAGAAGLVGILIGKHLHAACAGRVDVLRSASSTVPSSPGPAPSCARPRRSRRPAPRCRSLPAPRRPRRWCSRIRRGCGSSRRRRTARWPSPSRPLRRSSNSCPARNTGRSTGPTPPSIMPLRDSSTIRASSLAFGSRSRHRPSPRGGSSRAARTGRRWCRCAASRRWRAAPPDRSARRRQG